MTQMILHGCLGKMGRAVCRLAEEDANIEIIAGIDAGTSSMALPFPVFADPEDCSLPADVIVDFSTATAVPALLRYGMIRRIPVAICTTGLSEACKQEMQAASEKTAVFQSPNMSLGITLLAKLLKTAVQILSESHFDIEIAEKHHSQKIDAPSGTAVLLADAMNESGRYRYIYDRSQVRAKRSPDEIGIFSLRGGTIVGEHSVLFAGRDEMLEFTHTALSKDVFAAGALKAAQFLKGKPPGFYRMEDLLGAL
ncbi:MAG: 4-hydroxy-tetrahydrodipicolinate reductase [Clostridiales bacterium]|jgi:4-hydroxy-tetrahydrodipicolinate reductase|nr:4-hydroxy-tetrahydrodipicolinate reductase [Clostridiales bacterium]